MAPPSQLVDLNADLLPFLNMWVRPPLETVTELQGFIDDAVPVIEDIVGHVIPATFDELYSGGDTVIYLRELPVLSVTSIREVIGLVGYDLSEQPVGQAVDNYGYTLESPRTGRVARRGAGSAPYPFYANTANIEVVYTAGRASVPGNVRRGTLELIRHWWQVGQQSQGRVSSFLPANALDSDDSYSSTPAGYLVPNRVKELLAPDLRPIVFA